jgi:ribosome recycling factor
LAIPALTEERRHELVKIVRSRAEESRVAVRNVRRDVHNDLREFEREKVISEDDLKRGGTELQKITDEHIDAITKAAEKKESEVLEV